MQLRLISWLASITCSMTEQRFTIQLLANWADFNQATNPLKTIDYANIKTRIGKFCDQNGQHAENLTRRIAYSRVSYSKSLDYCQNYYYFKKKFSKSKKLTGGYKQCTLRLHIFIPTVTKHLYYATVNTLNSKQSIRKTKVGKSLCKQCPHTNLGTMVLFVITTMEPSYYARFLASFLCMVTSDGAHWFIYSWWGFIQVSVSRLQLKLNFQMWTNSVRKMEDIVFILQ